MYIINFKAINDLLTIKQEQPNIVETEVEETFDGKGVLIQKIKRVKTTPKPLEFDTVKFDLIYQLLLTYLNNDVQIDSTLGMERGIKDAPLEWQTAYKTLISYNILVEDDEE